MKLLKFYLYSMVLLFSYSNLSSATTRAIDLTIVNCKVVIKDIEDNGCDANQCAGESDCVCVNVNDKIKWNMPDGKKVKFKFKNKSPLKNCGNSFAKGHHHCPMRKDLKRGDVFNYDIIVKDCEEIFDPKIVIK